MKFVWIIKFELHQTLYLECFHGEWLGKKKTNIYTFFDSINDFKTFFLTLPPYK